MRPLPLFFVVLALLIVVGLGIYIATRPGDALPPPPPISCVPSWDCSDWSDCLGDEQFRTCTDKNACGSNEGKPETSQACEAVVCGNFSCELGETCASCPTDCGTCKPTCTESWNCTAWSPCTGGSQTRSCTDRNACGTAANRPPQFQSCTQGCTENWFCGNWSQCQGGNQARTCTDLNSCGTVNNKPPFSQSCTTQCTENWACGAWGTCTNGTQARTCSDVNACGTTANRPPLSQSCTAQCTENWTCSAWSVCTNSTQTRSCTDVNSCGTIINKPPESQSCTPPPPPPPVDTNPPTFTSFTATGGDSEVAISYTAADAATASDPLTYKILRGTSSNAVNGLTIASFDAPPTTVSFVRTSVSASGIAGTIVDVVNNDQTYYYRVRACDNAPALNCTLSAVVSASPVSPPLQLTLDTTTEAIFDYAIDRCNNEDIPDAPARVFRDSTGKIVFSTVNSPKAYFMTSDDFGSLKKSCTPAFTETNSFNPSTFTNNEWLWSFYTEDGTNVYALIHNEFHDPNPASDPPCIANLPGPGNPCYYVSITSAASADGGKSFSQLPSPSHLVGAVNILWDHTPVDSNNNPPSYGYSAPSNIIKRIEGGQPYYYATFAAKRIRGRNLIEPGTCLMRTTTLNDPSSWRAWDGQSFSIEMGSPYLSIEPRPCEFVGGGNIRVFSGSLTFNTYLNKYILTDLGTFKNPASNQLECNFWYTVSKDLIHWDKPRKIKSIPTCNFTGDSFVNGEAYPALVDHSDTSRNFEFTGKSPYLYYVKFGPNANAGQFRQVLRLKLQLDLL